MWQLVGVCLPMHRIWETLSVSGLVHWGPSAATRHTTDATDAHWNASNWALLDASSLRTDHINAGVVSVCTANANRRATNSLIWTTMVDSILICVSWMRMVAAGAHWNTVLLNVEMRVISWTTARRACTVYSVGRSTARDYDVLAVVEWGWSVRAHDVA